MTALADAVADALDIAVTFEGMISGGGDSQVWSARCADGRQIVVKHHRTAPAGMFAAQASGLAWLEQAADGPAVAQVLAARDAPPAFIVTERIAAGRWTVAAQERFGRQLAGLHLSGSECFGLAHDNFIATLAQSNAPTPTWPQFLAQRRIVPLTRAAVGLPARLRRDLDLLADRLPHLCGPAEPPARLHGDLWSGNVVPAASGSAVLIDPAVVGGHREVDLAMMRLFGGFPPRVFDAYDEVAPLAAGHRERVALNQVVPLLVHVVLFGAPYLAQLESAVAPYVRVR